jgi:hypothetical protein
VFEEEAIEKLKAGWT